MKAVIANKYGGPEVLDIQEVPKPVPGENEILIKIKASAVTAAGYAMREGKPLFGRLFLGLTKPKNPIPGTDLAGVIEAIGGEVSKFKLGDEVFAMTDTNMGGHAEYIVLPEDEIIALKPSNTTFEEASGILDGGCTALSFLRDQAQLKEGQHMLIIGASGGIGTAAVQIAKHMGAEVTGVCSTANVELVKSIGANHVIDYKVEDYSKGESKYDVVFDTVGKSSYKKAKNVLKDNGSYLTPVMTLGILGRMLFTNHFNSKKAKFSATGLRDVEPRQQDLNHIKELLDQGSIRCIIDRTYDLDEIREAHEYVDKGHKKGNVLLVINRD